MKGANALVVGFGVMLLVAIFAPLAVGDNDSLHVELIIADREYMDGDTINIELRVYDAGQLVNADGANDSVSVTMTRNHVWNNDIFISLTNDATGIYTGSYTIGTYDPNQDDYQLFFYHHVIRGDQPNQDEVETDHHNEAVYVPISDLEFDVDVNFDGQSLITARPGDVVTATIHARYGTANVGDAAFDNVVLINPEGHQVNLTTVFVATGISTATFNLPSIQSSGLYQVRAQPSDAGHEVGTAHVQVNVLDVWYHRLSVYGETVSFEVCVADSEGQPVNGANVVLIRDWWPDDIVKAGSTNELGKFQTSFTDVVDSVAVTGYVRHAGYNQSISGTLYNPQPDDPHHHGLDIIWNGEESMFAPGESVTIPYTAFMDQDMMPSQIIYYYVTAWGTDYGISHLVYPGIDQNDYLAGHVDGPYQVVAADTVQTSTIGQFSVEFTAPATQCLLKVVFEVPLADDFAIWDDSPSFYVTLGDLMGDDDVKVSGGEFKQGELSEASVTMPAMAGDSVTAFWMVGEHTIEYVDGDDFDPEWVCWTPAGNLITLTKISDEKYEGSYVLPAFIEEIETVTIVGGYMDGASGIPHYDVKYAGEKSGGSTLMIIGVIAAIVIVGLFLYLIKK